MLISNAIYGGERSLKRTSTASQLIFVRSLLLLHHLSTPPSPSPSSTTPVQLADEPLPSIEGCGLDFHQLDSLTSEDTAQPPLPFPKGCGRLSLVRQMIQGGRKTKGAHEVGFDGDALRNTSYNTCRGEFSLSTSYPPH